MTTGAAVLVGGCVVIPPELLAELHAELSAPRRQVPMSVAVPRRSSQMTALTDTVLTGAIAHNQALRESPRKRALGAQTPFTPSLAASVDRHAGLSDDGEVVGVAVASGMLGFSLQWTRALAKSGALPGARMSRSRSGNGSGPARLCWCIPLASVHAYLADRQVAR
jgi:hypothetical protein